MQPGFYPPSVLSNEDYHSGAGISVSGLKRMQQSPAHYKAGFNGSSQSMFIGTAIHAAALEPEEFERNYVIAEGFERKNQAGYKAWAEEQTRLILMPHEYENIKGMRDALHAHPVVGPMLRGATCEYSCYANDPVTGELCRVRFDILTADGWILDLKKCQDARPAAAAKSIAAYGYHMQNAFYMDVPEWLGHPPEGFAFVFIEEQAPYAIGVYVLNDQDVERGRLEYRRMLNKYHECKLADNWPSYGIQPQEIELPRWKRNEIDFNNQSGESHE